MLRENSQFSHFKILRQLGSGGMGQVFLAEDQKLGRQVAIKILQTDVFSDQERKERFQREARTAARVSHSNVMAVYDIDEAAIEEGQQPVTYLVMEYVNGLPLAEYLQTNRIEMSEIVRLAEKIASGLTAAHQLGIVHRDIKADNILVTADKEPKILDFGLAKAVDPVQWGDGKDVTATISKELTRAGKIVGTVSYMSPEQARGEQVDARSDIFSFGILLYRMVTGVMPFDGSTQVSTLAKILESQHEPAHLKNANVPAELERIIEKCLRKDAGDRYQHTQDLVVDLRNLRRQFDSGITETVSVIRDKSTLQTGKMAVVPVRVRTIGLAIVLIAALALAYKIFFPSSGSSGDLQASENRIAVLAFENKTGEGDLDWLQTGLPEILLTDLGQNLSLELLSSDRLRDYLNKDHSAGPDFTLSQYRDAARSLGVKTVISGAFYRVDTLIRIDARIEDVVTGKIISAEKVQGGKSDPFGLVDSLTGKVLTSLNLRDQSEGQSIENLLTSSPEAYRVYLDGMKKMGEGRYDEAIEQFKKATELDTMFALAYLRTGMAYVFSGKMQMGTGFVAKAKSLQGKLPPRERAMVDVYSDVWLENEYDAAFAKQEAYVRSYPTDKEGLCIYAILLWQLRRDSTSAETYLDSALSLDPNYSLALRFYIDVTTNLRQYDKAIAMAKRLVEAAPDAPNALVDLADLYATTGDKRAALETYRRSLDKFPKDQNTISSIAWLFAQNHEFDSAMSYLDKFKVLADGDPYRMINYYSLLANLRSWQGKFLENLSIRKLALKEAHKTKDSIQIANALRIVGINFERFDMKDSAAAYLFDSYRHASTFTALGFPMMISELDPVKYGDTAKAIWKRIAQESRSRLPSEMWPLLDGIEAVVYANASGDTAAQIDAIKRISELQKDSPVSGNNFAVGSLCAKSGRYAEAIPHLQPFIEGGTSSGNAFYYLVAHYYLGLCYQGMGDTKKAISHYEEILKYWGEPDFELEEIKDTRVRLQQLRG